MLPDAGAEVVPEDVGRVPEVDRRMLSDALRKHAAIHASRILPTSTLLRLAKVAALCTLAEDRVSAENRERLMALLGQDADAPTD